MQQLEIHRMAPTHRIKPRIHAPWKNRRLKIRVMMIAQKRKLRKVRIKRAMKRMLLILKMSFVHSKTLMQLQKIGRTGREYSWSRREASMDNSRNSLMTLHFWFRTTSKRRKLKEKMWRTKLINSASTDLAITLSTSSRGTIRFLISICGCRNPQMVRHSSSLSNILSHLKSWS